MGRHQRCSARVVAAVLAFGTATQANAAQDPAAPPATAWPDTPPPPAPAPAPQIAAAPISEKEAIREVLRNDPEIGPRYRRGRGMVIGGAVSLGSAGGMLLIGGMFALLGEVAATAPDNEGGTGSDERAIAVGFALAAGVLVVVGVPLVVLGARRRTDAIADARRRVSLGMGPRGFGLRF